jgi:hypothetical protein
LIVTNNVKTRRVAVVLYLLRNLQNMYSNKQINFPYLRVINNLSSVERVIQKFVSCLQILGPIRFSNKETFSMLIL